VCCALLSELDGQAVAEVVLAGHPPAYHIVGGRPRQVGNLAPFLGAFDDVTWKPEVVALRPGDQLVLYTDGVIDTVGEVGRFGEDRLAEALAGSSSAADSVRRIETAVNQFAQGTQGDDTAVLVVERLAGPVAAGTLEVLARPGRV
jgi:sigma-B regulation protein RsbU (phosphoserine phosphatase)